MIMEKGIMVNKLLKITAFEIKISAGRLIKGGAPILIIAPKNQNRLRSGISFINPLVKISLRELEIW